MLTKERPCQEVISFLLFFGKQFFGMLFSWSPIPPGKTYTSYYVEHYVDSILSQRIMLTSKNAYRIRLDSKGYIQSDWFLVRVYITVGVCVGNKQIGTHNKYSKSLPTDIHSGGRMVHFPLFFKATASHSGTWVAICGKNGPKSPCQYIKQRKEKKER